MSFIVTKSKHTFYKTVVEKEGYYPTLYIFYAIFYVKVGPLSKWLYFQILYFFILVKDEKVYSTSIKSIIILVRIYIYIKKF